MTEEPSVSPREASGNSWPKVVLVLGLLALLILPALWMVQKILSAPGASVDKGVAVVKALGHEAATVIGAFRQQTIRQEFLSTAVTLEGHSRLQVATLKEDETFRRKEQDSVAWGWIALPEVVVQADVPVEYTYFLDFHGPWQFARENDVVTVHAPPIRANSPAPDVSKLTFYTLEGHIWQDDNAVRERLRGSLTPALRERAEEHVKLVREIARKQTEDFVRNWLVRSYTDGKAFQVKVVFPDEEVPVVKPGSERPSFSVPSKQ